MAERHSVKQSGLIEDALQDLRGVRSAKVELDAAGVESVKVLVIPERSSSQTVTDIQSVIQEQVGAEIDPSAIEILRTAQPNPAMRRKLASVLTERAGERFKARVTLELDGDVLVGETEAPRGSHFEHRTMARATLNGVEELIAAPMELENVRFVSEGDHRFAIVMVNRGGESLIGSAAVRLDDYDAIARATLDAVNRFIAGSTEPQLVG